MGESLKGSFPIHCAIINLAQAEIKKYESQNTLIESLMKQAKNIPTEKGYLKIDKNNNLHIKKNITISSFLIALGTKKPELPDDIKRLDTNIKPGKITSREKIISEL